MHIAFLNIQGNFDTGGLYWASHPDFGGQLVYVKEVCLALGRYTWETTAVGYRGVLEEILRTETARPEGLPIPVYFMSPGPDSDIGIDSLRGIASPPPASPS